MDQSFYSPVDPKHITKEKAKARELRQSQWWKQILAKGLCHYCEKKFPKDQITMEHILPIGRGGHSTKGNIVAACKTCNTNKGYRTPAELALATLKST